MNLPANPREDVILELANSDTEIFGIMHQAIMANGIDVKAYAAVFQYLCGDMRPSNERLSYLAGSKVWKQGNKQLTDMAVLQELSIVTRMMREYVLLSWESCIFSAWLPARELQQAEKAMDAMESIDKLKEILDVAASNMVSAKNMANNKLLPSTKEKEADGVEWEAPDDDDGWNPDI